MFVRLRGGALTMLRNDTLKANGVNGAMDSADLPFSREAMGGG